MYDSCDVRQEAELRRLSGQAANLRYTRLGLLRRDRRRAKAKQVQLPERDWNRVEAPAPATASVLLDLYGLPPVTLRVAAGLMSGETQEVTTQAAGITIREYRAACDALRDALSPAGA